MAFSRTSTSEHAAHNTVSGVVSNGVTWVETVILTDQDGNQLTGVASDTWQFQFRCNEHNKATDLTLSTTDGTLTINEGDTQTTLNINVPQGTISGMCGDYVADLVSKAASDGTLTHRAHGLVTFRDSPVAY